MPNSTDVLCRSGLDNTRPIPKGTTGVLVLWALDYFAALTLMRMIVSDGLDTDVIAAPILLAVPSPLLRALGFFRHYSS